MSSTLRFAAATALLALALACRARLSDPMPWLWVNVALAWFPFVVGRIAARNRGLLVGLLPMWLLFLPNAPYLVTDLIHLHPRADVPLWLDVVILGGAGALGLAMGARSLLDVHAAVRRELGPGRAAALAIAVPPLVGLAIWVGRFARFNSWDVLRDPIGLLGDGFLPLLAAPRAHAQDWAYVAAHGALFAVAAWIGAPEAETPGGRRLIAGMAPRILGDPPEPT